jgi:hypothetical protein
MQHLDQCYLRIQVLLELVLNQCLCFHHHCPEYHLPVLLLDQLEVVEVVRLDLPEVLVLVLD